MVTPVRKEDMKKYRDNSNEHINAKSVTIAYFAAYTFRYL
jgi:7-cyano-7-deazaguanine synthase in queuosine biosynthesis